MPLEDVEGINEGRDLTIAIGITTQELVRFLYGDRAVRRVVKLDFLASKNNAVLDDRAPERSAPLQVGFSG